MEVMDFPRSSSEIRQVLFVDQSPAVTHFSRDSLMEGVMQMQWISLSCNTRNIPHDVNPPLLSLCEMSFTGCMMWR